jgi:DNA invertase Pin-like site-specific DNA recombinase
MNRQEAVASMPRRQRCAIYTRKSSEEGLDMEFNSLDAQREACEAFVTSQKAEGWATIRERYDDGGFSGGTLERPGLKRLLQDVEAGLIDVIMVYKIDRLSRSLMDFAKLVEVFDRNQVTFVSVTQSFNTTTSMGRLTLNILLSFAQFEREVIGERIRDKVAASRKRGMWMGGHVPLGYDVRDRKLVVNEAEAATVRMIFERFVAIGSATTLAKALAAEGVLNKRGKPIDKGFLYKLISNRVYLGEAVQRGTAYPGGRRIGVDLVEKQIARRHGAQADRAVGAGDDQKPRRKLLRQNCVAGVARALRFDALSKHRAFRNQRIDALAREALGQLHRGLDREHGSWRMVDDIADPVVPGLGRADLRRLHEDDAARGVAGR